MSFTIAERWVGVVCWNPDRAQLICPAHIVSEGPESIDLPIDWARAQSLWSVTLIRAWSDQREIGVVSSPARVVSSVPLIRTGSTLIRTAKTFRVASRRLERRVVWAGLGTIGAAGLLLRFSHFSKIHTRTDYYSSVFLRCLEASFHGPNSRAQQFAA